MPTVKLEGVSKKFGQLYALKDVDIDIDGPGCIGILGPNGAGKTTMLKILTNIVKPSAGNALINGISVSEYPARALSTVGALVEQPEFYPYLTAREILSFVIKIKQVKRKEEDEIRRVSELTSITSYLDRKAGQFSRGMKQRLGLAVALVGDPDILILDEPTFGLDPSGMKSVREIIRELNASKEIIILLSTHLIHEAQEVCDRIVIINQGTVGYDTTNNISGNIRIEFEAKPDGIDFPDHLAKNITRDGNSIYLKKNDGTENSEIIRFCQENGLKIKWVTPYNDLEDTYVSITNGK